MANLTYFKKKLDCKVYAYCLMDNHVHLLIAPGDTPQNISLLLKYLAGRQTKFTNKQLNRTGSLWEGRFKSYIVESPEYLLACCRYIELNPVRAAMVDDPADYRWSSCACKSKGEFDQLVDFDDNYLALGDTMKERANAYRLFMRDSITEQELKITQNVLYTK